MLTREVFAGALGQRFDQAEGEDAVPLTLAEIDGASDSARPFSLLFHAPGPEVMEQRIYSLINATMGELDIFLVPIAREGDRIVYQAVFN